MAELILEWGAINHRRAWGEQWDEVIKSNSQTSSNKKSGGNMVFAGRPHQKNHYNVDWKQLITIHPYFSSWGSDLLWL